MVKIIHRFKVTAQIQGKKPPNIHLSIVKCSKFTVTKVPEPQGSNCKLQRLKIVRLLCS